MITIILTIMIMIIIIIMIMIITIYINSCSSGVAGPSCRGRARAERGGEEAAQPYYYVYHL